MCTVTDAISAFAGWHEYFPLSLGLTDEMRRVDVDEESIEGFLRPSEDVSTVMPPRGEE